MPLNISISPEAIVRERQDMGENQAKKWVAQEVPAIPNAFVRLQLGCPRCPGSEGRRPSFSSSDQSKVVIPPSVEPHSGNVFGSCPHTERDVFCTFQLGFDLNSQCKVCQLEAPVGTAVHILHALLQNPPALLFANIFFSVQMIFGCKI